MEKVAYHLRIGAYPASVGFYNLVTQNVLIIFVLIAACWLRSWIWITMRPRHGLLILFAMRSSMLRLIPNLEPLLWPQTISMCKSTEYKAIWFWVFLGTLNHNQVELLLAEWLLQCIPQITMKLTQSCASGALWKSNSLLAGYFFCHIFAPNQE